MQATAAQRLKEDSVRSHSRLSSFSIYSKNKLESYWKHLGTIREIDTHHDCQETFTRKLMKKCVDELHYHNKMSNRSNSMISVVRPTGACKIRPYRKHFFFVDYTVQNSETFFRRKNHRNKYHIAILEHIRR